MSAFSDILEAVFGKMSRGYVVVAPYNSYQMSCQMCGAVLLDGTESMQIQDYDIISNLIRRVLEEILRRRTAPTAILMIPHLSEYTTITPHSTDEGPRIMVTLRLPYGWI